MPRKAVFLDRDGTINKEVNYLGRPEDWRLIPGAVGAIRVLREHGWLVVLITNQSGVARGYYTEQDVQAVNARLAADLEEAGAGLDGLYLCLHHPDAGCECRKPKTLLFRQAASDLDIDFGASVTVGDKVSDLEPGLALGGRTVLVLTGHGQEHLQIAQERGLQFDYVAADLDAAARWIMAADLGE